MSDFRMPSLGADMDAGTLVEWRVKPGDAVKRGDVVALVETDKGLIEIEIWESGVVDNLLVPRGTKVPVGTILATLRDGVAAAPSAPPAPPPPPPPPSPSQHVRASPAAKQLARERGIDVTTIHGTGPHDTITRTDVEQVSSPARKPELDLAGMRRAIAKAMSRSKREIPHYYLSTDIDLMATLAWLTAENEKRAVPDRVLLAAVFIKATAQAARAVPEMNGFFVDDAFRPSTAVHAGVAISLRGGGLVAPAIHDVDTKSIADVQVGLRDLVARTRASTLRSSEMTDPTITVTNLGDQGVAAVFGVIYPPQVAIVGFGKVVERPWAVGGMLGVHPVVTATLAADHRVSDGHRGGVFLATIDRLLQKPEEL